MTPGIPKGTRDFGPAELYKRRYIFNTIRKYFELYGYAPIETPSMENLDTLLGKYGDEGDQLLFKVLNNGDFLGKVPTDILESQDSKKATSHLSKRGLRYDLTIPFARYAVMHRHEINLPFKRYQIQPVWRADRPQKGRYQEFYQCDADVIGSESLQYEAECILLFDDVFRELGMEVDIRFNNRKLLTALCALIGAPDLLVPITTAIDKLDKIGWDGVQKILLREQLDDPQISTIERYLKTDNLQDMRQLMGEHPIGMEGVNEIGQVLDFLQDKNLHATVTFDPTLARGLSYYTGSILEVKSTQVEMGSIGGGGRYDDLTTLFGGEKLGGMGISFGAERIYDVMEELRLLDHAEIASPVLVLTLDDEFHNYGFDIVCKLRQHGLRADLYPTGARLKKQMKYANKINSRFILIVGSEEMDNQSVSVRDMETGDQSTMKVEQAIQFIQQSKER